MLTAKEREDLEKAAQTADLLVRDIVELTGADNPLLAELGNGMLTVVGSLRQQLARLVVATKPAEAADGA
jgi:hypothetical protein